ncbi:MAG: hypothetical protein HYX53_05035 [Chloroflexi bacterium]|nr:hypothetical protein [Chloroflexota bacterium]
MSSTIPVRAVLMSSDIKSGAAGFHRLVYKVDGGRSGMVMVAVMISQDAHRKLAAQLTRARLQPVEKSQLLKTWARWEIAMRLEYHGVIPQNITITASDVDDFGAYATDLARTLGVG